MEKFTLRNFKKIFPRASKADGMYIYSNKKF